MTIGLLTLALMATADGGVVPPATVERIEERSDRYVRVLADGGTDLVFAVDGSGLPTTPTAASSR